MLFFIITFIYSLSPESDFLRNERDLQNLYDSVLSQADDFQKVMDKIDNFGSLQEIVTYFPHLTGEHSTACNLRLRCVFEDYLSVDLWKRKFFSVSDIMTILDDFLAVKQINHAQLLLNIIEDSF